jgi:hypothetical protein
MISANKSREPLLYIHQPNIEFPEAEMQQSYSIRKAELEKNQSSPLVQNTVNPVAENQIDLEGSIKSEQPVKERVSNTLPTHNSKLNETILQNSSQTNTTTQPQNVQEVISAYDEQARDEDETATKKQPYSFKRLKSFKDMSLEEKLNYLINFPKLLPPVPCIFVTNSTSVRGIILSKNEQSIEVKQFNDKIESIELNDLVEIKMIGLNK